jgi:Methyltransferase domain
VERLELDADTAATLRALNEGRLPWTLHPDCEYGSDPGQWGASLVNDAEILVACLDAAKPQSVVEVGAFAGDVTRLLLEWASRDGTRVWAVEPFPKEELTQLAAERSDLELVRATSHEALKDVPPAEAVIIDGDHNYFTVIEELRLIEAKAGRERLPLLMFHDVCWPHGRRDDYYDPELVPEDQRQPTEEGGGLFPGSSSVQDGGLPYRWPAAHEGGPHNGVLTAIEDFVAERDELSLAVVPAFFGLGVVWHRDAPWAAAIAEVVERWDRDPLVQRLEANRVFHLASVHFQMMRMREARERVAQQEALLRRLLGSSAFSVAERLSRLRQRVGIAPAQSVVSKDAVRRVLSE